MTRVYVISMLMGIREFINTVTSQRK